MKGQAVSRPDEGNWFIKPGLHSHNARRRLDPHFVRHRAIRFAQMGLFVLGLCGIAYYGYSLADQYIYQAYENWAFDQHIAGRTAAFADYLREKTPFGFLTGYAPSTTAAMEPNAVGQGSLNQPGSRPENGSVLGRVNIGRLGLLAIVRQGVDDDTLSRAAGHLPSTALPGEIGNFAIAAHRDTLFRALKDIQTGDEVKFESSSGIYTYKVISTKIVRPSDLTVIEPQGSDRLLTMITCYPFYYIGSAPKRFIVQARLIDSNNPDAASSGASSFTQAQGAGPPRVQPVAEAGNSATGQPTPSKTSKREPRHMRGFSSRKTSSASSSRSSEPRAHVSSNGAAAHKKHQVWRKLFHHREDQ